MPASKHRGGQRFEVAVNHSQMQLAKHTVVDYGRVSFTALERADLVTLE